MSTHIESKQHVNTPTVKVAVKLAALWAAVMFLYAYADITHFVLQTGSLEEITNGAIAGVPISSLFLLGTAVLMSIPSVMIFLSVGLKPNVVRWIHIVVGSLFTLMSASTALLPFGGAWLYYRYYNLVEAVLTGLIVYFAWTWPKREAFTKKS